MIDNLTLRIQTAESAEERRGRKMCQIICEPQRPLRFKNKDKINEKSNRRERRGTRRMENVSDNLRTSASSAVQEQRQNSYKFKPQRAQMNADGGKCVRYSANLSVLCGSKTNRNIQNHRSLRGSITKENHEGETWN